jgi:predicted Rossmann-fold nucleotide-binding protein
LLNIAGYYDDLLRFLDHAVAERFIKLEHRSSILIAANPEELLDQLARYNPPHSQKWIDRIEKA